MSKFKVWVFLYILLSAMNLNISYASTDVEDIDLQNEVIEVNL